MSEQDREWRDTQLGYHHVHEWRDAEGAVWVVVIRGAGFLRKVSLTELTRGGDGTKRPYT